MAKCQGVVGQRKMYCAVTRKRNMSKVSPGLGLWEYGKSRIWYTALNGSMVVMRSNYHC